ncbi:glucosaminidase domain-containing protein [Tannockella kyphosi]|uniref:glucosaminidase domain-containing protein n=1 Tax=Tannockella kyphosi TaxID=2899121 RepID=UPI0020113F95|nr:glucosaminidase domain-containing protein [Tannockella kyphosi]
MKIRKQLITITTLVVAICVLINYVGVDTQADYDDDVFTDFIAMDEEGNIVVYSQEEIETPDEEAIAEIEVEVVEETVGSTLVEVVVNAIANIFSLPNIEISASDDSIEYAVVRFGTSGTTTYTNYDTGTSGYTYGGSAPDAAYLGTTSDGYVIFKQGGVTGKVKASAVTIIEYDDFVEAGYVTSIYTCINGNIYHKITTNLTSYASTQIVGYQQEYMEDGVTYYSYDGHYFYTSYTDMIDDYVAGTTSKAINPSDPYYSYYQYLSHRSTTNFTEEQIEGYIQSKTTSSSLMYDLAGTFVEEGETYGTNAILMLGVAINESAWGTSNIAMNTNNLFGHSAYDSDPSGSASKYSSAAYSVYVHAYSFLSKGYLYGDDYRYFGPHLGDKQSGINVKYASDPYWGEKAAAHGYLIENMYSDEIYDYNSEIIGIVDDVVKIYADTSLSSDYMYTTSNNYDDVDDMAMLIIEEVVGETVDGSNVWYKIQTDIPLNSTRTDAATKTTVYNFDRDYGYVHSSEFDYISDGDLPVVVYLAGDVNMDGSRTSMDYMLIKSHILGKTTLSGTSLIIADVNEDGVLTSMDYMLIKSHILGKTNLDE